MDNPVVQRRKSDASEVDAGRNWSELPPEMVRAFASRLDCNLDRLNVTLQCTSWRDALAQEMRARQLPWLLVPYRRTCLLHPGVLRRAHFFCFLSRNPHKVNMPPNAYGARFISAYDGGWMFLALGQRCGYVVVNLKSRVQVQIPDVLLCQAFPIGESIVLRAATLSCPPDQESNCVVGAIATTLEPPFLCRTFVAFCRIGAPGFSCVTEIEAEDVTYFRGFFYVLSKIEDLIVCKPEYEPGSAPNLLTVNKEYLHFLPLEHENGLYVKARYVVESRGEILMVVRYTTLLTEHTQTFAVFRMIPDIETGPYFAWEKMDDLDGRMIFVGRGCSRCFETIEFLDSHQGVYFHDDEAFNMPTMIAYGYNGRKYPCHDNGCWPGNGERMKKWYEWKLTSSYTSPVWLLH